MNYQPIQIQPGVYRNGTELQQSGRWRDASLVRWRDGSMEPIGGWSEWVDLSSGIYRGSIAWVDNSNLRWFATGSADALKVMGEFGATYDITPAGLTAGLVSATQNTGFGGGAFGADAYNGPRTPSANYEEATVWSMSTWGENLLACNASDGVIYEWALNTGTPAAALTNAPVDNLGVIVTPERFVFALGAGGDVRKVQWSDREDGTTWTPAATNEAGDQTLEAVGQIMCAVNTQRQTLIFTDHEVFAAEFQGSPFVYGFNKVGASCGVVSRGVVAETPTGAIWMGLQSFWGYFGGAVEAVPCDVSDYVFNDINRIQITKAFAVNNAQHDEIWWFYPSGDSTENDRYVSYNHREKHWSIGELARTAGIDRGVLGYPVYLAPDSLAYRHESGLNYGGADVYAESGPITLGGSMVVTATELLPDEKTQGDVTATFKTRLHPNGTETTFGPYTMSAPTSIRVTGRQIRLRVDGDRLADWRWGIPRVLVQQRGRR